MTTKLATQPNERTAAQAYAEKRQNILALAAQMGALLQSHGKREVNWCHVGDMTEIEAKLQECVAFLGGE